MPQLQTLDWGEPETSALESTLKGFFDRRQEQKETDSLKEIYSRYQSEGRNIEDAIFQIQTDPNIGPTRRVEAAKGLVDAKKANAKILKDERTLNKEAEKQRIANELDAAEVNFLRDIEGQNIPATEIYSKARQAGIPAPRANNIATLSRLEKKNERMTNEGINKQYQYEINDLDKKIKAENSPSKRKPLIEQRDLLTQQRKADLARLRAGESDFTLAMHAEDQDPEVKQEIEQMKGAIAELTKDYPPSENKGEIFTDPDTGIKYISDGKEWLPKLNPGL